MHSHSLGKYMSCIYDNDWRGRGNLMLSSAEKLARSGRRFPDLP